MKLKFIAEPSPDGKRDHVHVEKDKQGRIRIMRQAAIPPYSVTQVYLSEADAEKLAKYIAVVTA